MTDAPSLAGARVLVTGASGFIGRKVVEVVLSAGATPVGVGLDLGAVQGDVEVHDVDLTHAGESEAPRLRADMMIHLAAKSGGIQLQHGSESLFDVNTRITRNAFRLAASAGVRRVFVASSAVVYSSAHRTLLRESDPVLNPSVDEVSEYAWSKLTDESRASWYANRGLFETVIGRFANVYGPGGSFEPSRSTVIHGLIKRLIDSAPGEPLEVWGTGDAERTFIDVGDAARAVVGMLADGVVNETYNVSSSAPILVRDLAALIVDRSGLDRELQFRPDRPEGPKSRLLDTAKLRALGFEPEVTMAEGIQATLEYCRRMS